MRIVLASTICRRQLHLARGRPRGITNLNMYENSLRSWKGNSRCLHTVIRNAGTSVSGSRPLNAKPNGRMFFKYRYVEDHRDCIDEAHTQTTQNIRDANTPSGQSISVLASE
jgi:hypothetical protein